MAKQQENREGWKSPIIFRFMEVNKENSIRTICLKWFLIISPSLVINKAFNVLQQSEYSIYKQGCHQQLGAYKRLQAKEKCFHPPHFRGSLLLVDENPVSPATVSVATLTARSGSPVSWCVPWILAHWGQNWLLSASTGENRFCRDGINTAGQVPAPHLRAVARNNLASAHGLWGILLQLFHYNAQNIYIFCYFVWHSHIY